MLDAGCGWGRYVLLLSEYEATSVGIDSGLHLLQLGRVLAELEQRVPPTVMIGSGVRSPFQNLYPMDKRFESASRKRFHDA